MWSNGPLHAGGFGPSDCCTFSFVWNWPTHLKYYPSGSRHHVRSIYFLRLLKFTHFCAALAGQLITWLSAPVLAARSQQPFSGHSGPSYTSAIALSQKRSMPSTRRHAEIRTTGARGRTRRHIAKHPRGPPLPRRTCGRLICPPRRGAAQHTSSITMRDRRR